MCKLINTDTELKIVLNQEEYELYCEDSKDGKKYRKCFYEAAMMIAGDAGGWGIHLVNEKGVDLSSLEYEYQFGRPKNVPVTPFTISHFLSNKLQLRN